LTAPAARRPRQRNAEALTGGRQQFGCGRVDQGHASAMMTMDLYGHLADGNLWQAARVVRGHLCWQKTIFHRI
jgi:hypothetical protein